MKQQRGKKLSTLKIAAMEQDWITIGLRPNRKDFAQKHEVSESSVKKYHALGKWTLKRIAYWENLDQVVGEVSQVALAQASKSNGLATGEQSIAHQQEETVANSVEVVGRFIAGAVNQREDENTKLMAFIKNTFAQVFQRVAKNFVITSTTPKEAEKEIIGKINELSTKEQLLLLPILAKVIIDIQRIEEVMQGRPDHRVEIIGTPLDLSPQEEAALEVVQRISVRRRKEE